MDRAGEDVWAETAVTCYDPRAASCIVTGQCQMRFMARIGVRGLHRQALLATTIAAIIIAVVVITAVVLGGETHG